jgi:radical SAM superfamily enzyme YgiQ (UPF0313 family)
MKILLVNVAFHYFGKDKFPLGLGYIAAMAQSAQHQVKIIDENVGDEILYDEITDYDVIGFTLTTPAFKHAKEIITEIKRRKFLNQILIAGGHHATFRAEEVLNCGIDVIFRGEVEHTFSLFLSALSENKTWHSIPNISYRSESGEIHHNQMESLNPNINAIPFPAWNLFNISKYDPMSVITSRGCPFRCSYCSAAAFWQNQTRFRDIPNIIDELLQLQSKYHVSYIKFQDSVFTLNKTRVLELLNAILNANLKFDWTCETRADLLDSEILFAMRKAGCSTIMIGLESGAQQILDTADRKMHVEQIIEKCKLIREHGMGFRVSVIFGLPGETKETVEETLKLLHIIEPNVIFLNLATVYPGCALEGQKTVKQNELWVQTFSGHGIGGDLILPKGMNPRQYRQLANYLNEEIHIINKIHWKKDQN